MEQLFSHFMGISVGKLFIKMFDTVIGINSGKILFFNLSTDPNPTARKTGLKVRGAVASNQQRSIDTFKKIYHIPSPWPFFS